MTENIRILSQASDQTPPQANSAALTHGTFVAGVLAARRGTAAPAICPGCTLMVRPIFLQPSALAINLNAAKALGLAINLNAAKALGLEVQGYDFNRMIVEFTMLNQAK